LNVDISASNNLTEVANSIGLDHTGDKKVVASRVISKLLTDFLAEVTLEIPVEAIGDIYNQLPNAIPIPLPPISNPALFAKILGNLEL